MPKGYRTKFGFTYAANNLLTTYQYIRLFELNSVLISEHTDIISKSVSEREIFQKNGLANKKHL